MQKAPTWAKIAVLVGGIAALFGVFGLAELANKRQEAEKRARQEWLDEMIPEKAPVPDLPPIIRRPEPIYVMPQVSPEE